MKKTEIRSPLGHMIPCDYDIENGDKKVCIIAHGFGSSKESSTAQLMIKHLRTLGVGSAAFDFPCHGESTADYHVLTVDACLRDMEAVERWAWEQSGKNCEIYYFGSSFGAYMTITHMCEGPAMGRKAFLRCAAVDMDQSFGIKTEEVMDSINKCGYSKYDPGFGDGLKLSEAFFDSMAGRSPFDMELPEGTEIQMIHGLCDDIVPVEQAKKYAAMKGCPITLVPDTGHGIDSEEGIETLLKLTSEFFSK